MLAGSVADSKASHALGIWDTVKASALFELFSLRRWAFSHAACGAEQFVEGPPVAYCTTLACSMPSFAFFRNPSIALHGSCGHFIVPSKQDATPARPSPPQKSSDRKMCRLSGNLIRQSEVLTLPAMQSCSPRSTLSPCLHIIHTHKYTYIYIYIYTYHKGMRMYLYTVLFPCSIQPS